MYELPSQALKAMSLLENAGYEAFAVGGCVRDMLMGKALNDIDITTNALPHQTKEVFSAYHTIDTGIKHGTVTAIIDSEPIEITTYRIESDYSDGRHPDKVMFTGKLTDDLSRRDFTVNSIAYNPNTGIIDPFGGEDDIKMKVIRCVGNPIERFREDSLRILRALRFSSVLGFTLEENTAKAVITERELMKGVSKERIYTEITKMLCGKDIRRVLLNYSEAIETVLPELRGMKGFDQRNFHHIYDILEHTAAVTESIPAEIHLRLAALFHDCGKPECFSLDSSGTGHFYAHSRRSADKAEAALIRLKSDKETREKVVKLVKLHDTPIEPEETVIKKKLNKYGEGLFFDLIKLQRADNMGLSPDFRFRQEIYTQIEDIARKIIIDSECFSLKDLAVNGNDMIKLGLKGKQIGEGLDFLLNAVIDGKCENDRDSLMLYYHTNV